MRSKEDALDYRFFPEPDLPQLHIDEEIMKRLSEQKVEIPYSIIKTFKEDYGFNKEYINALIGDKEMLYYFQKSLIHLTSSEDSSSEIPAKLVAKRIC
jgi:aspartyl-tRNA(Asn)/glutamyl-tRNA(Gln) amidotransferase subunit B